MPYFAISYLCVVLCLIFAFIALRADKKGIKITSAVGSAITLLDVIVTFFVLEVPAPEIYTTNGDSQTKNEVYFKTEWPLEVWYTLTPYDNPENGVKYKDSILIENSTSISAKACFANIKWSRVESRDIIIDDNGEVKFVETDELGTSIKEIRANIVTDKLFPGDKLTREDLCVEGINIAGETIPIVDYQFSPDTISEGINEITIVYQKFESIICYEACIPKLVKIKATYTGDKLVEGDEINKDCFEVFGIYEDDRQEQLLDYNIEPSVVDRGGNFPINVSKDNISTSITVYVDEMPKNSFTWNEKHVPNDAMNSVSIKVWSDAEDLDIAGKRHSGGLKITISNMFSSLGSGINNPVTSKITITNDDGRPLVDHFEGIFVVDQSMFNSKSYGTISILVDGEEKYNTGKIDSSTRDNFPFSIDIDGADSMIINTEAVINNGDFTFGFVNE